MSQAEHRDESGRTAAGKRVLVAEDSPVTQDLLKLILGQRGHSVDIVHDGEQALAALRSRAYDVALLDFHLPRRDGLEVAAAARAAMAGARRPLFVAITADVEGLLAHSENCENFDLIVPKPLDISEICAVIEEDVELPPDRPKGPRLVSPSPAAVAEQGTPPEAARRPESAPSPILQLGYEFLSWPEDLDGARLSARAMKAITGEAAFDAVLVRQPATPQELAVLWQRKQLHTLPVIDAAGRLGPRADVDASRLSYGDREAVDRLISAFHERRAGLHRDLLLTSELGEKLLGRIYLAGGRLQAHYDPSAPQLFSYDAVIDTAVAAAEAEQQGRKGFLRSEFFDRFQLCGNCGSSRLNVREECGKCRSPNLSEQPYLHHFKCAYQGVESDFRRGEDLICPKCRQELAHFSIDYDKPGALVLCGACGHTASEPAIGFLCTDCRTHSDADAARIRDVHSYHLTDQGQAFAETGRAFLGPAQQTLRFSELPLNLVVALNGAARRFNEAQEPFSLLDISYVNERDIVREHGPRQFTQTRDQFLENLRSLLRKDDQVFKGHAYDFALLRGVGPDETRQGLEYLQKEAMANLRSDLGVNVQLFGPEDFA